ncbi:MAG: hypothetical protein KY464_17600 [Gemmatimonadetes bacterium]|nr:hypothetical protein [Gemmatimonadota bacterium]
MLATDLADFLVRSGTPFREAHEQVGRLVRAAETDGCALSALSPETFSDVSEHFRGADIPALFDPRSSLEARSNPGGTGTSSVRTQIEALRETL